MIESGESGFPEWVTERVRAGEFATEAEVLEAARRALEAVEDLDPGALRSEVLAIRQEGAEELRADLQRALDELERGEGVPAPLAEIVLWESRLAPDEREMLERLRADAARVAAEGADEPPPGEPALIIERLLREHVTRWLVPREFAESIMERVRTGRYRTVEHVLYAAVAGLELMEADPAASEERLRRILTEVDERLAGGGLADGDDALRLVRRRAVLGELLAYGAGDRPERSD